MALLSLISLGLRWVLPLALAQISVPELTGPVIDDGGLFSENETRSISQLIRQKEPVFQAQIWTVKSLDGEAIESLSMRAVEKWKLGTAKKDNGLLILIAPHDRRMRIEVGQGLEGAIPDVIAGRVIDQIMKPRFRNGAFYEGTTEALTYLYSRVETPGQARDLPPSRASNGNGESHPLLQIIFLAIFFIFIFPRFWPLFLLFGGGRSNGWGSSGGGGWGSGGGGGWSGGGGGFSGGGSSGNW